MSEDASTYLTEVEIFLKKRQLYRSVVENTPDVITRWNKDLKLVYANPALEKKTGVSNESLYGKNSLEMGLPDATARPWMVCLQNVFTSGNSVEHCKSFRAPNDASDFHSRLVPEKNDRGKVETVLVIARSITREIDLDQPLQEDLSLFQGIIDAANVGLAVFKAIRNNDGDIENFQIEFINQRTKDAFGGKDITGTFLTDMGPDGLEQLKYCKQAIETGEKNSYTKKAESGIIEGWFLLSNAPLGGDHLVHTWEDITEIKRAEQQINENRVLLQSILNVSHNSVTYMRSVRDENNNITDFEWVLVNNTLKDRVGGKELVGGHYAREYPGVKKTDVFSKFVTCVEKDERQDFELYYNHENFDDWYRIIVTKLDDGIVLSSENITERKRSELELLNLKEQLNEQLRERSDEIETIDRVTGVNFSILKSIRNNQGRVIDFEWTFASKAKHELLAIKNLVGLRFSEVSLMNKKAGLIERYIAVVNTGNSVDFEAHYPENGLDLWLEFSAVKHGDGVAVITKDITDRKYTEATVLRLKDELAQRATDKYLSIFNSMDEGFHLTEVIFGKNGEVVNLAIHEENPVAKLIFGESWVGRTIRQIRPDYEQSRMQAWGEVVRTGENQRLVRYSPYWNKWIDLHLTKLGGEDSNFVVSIFRDITEQKEAEEALRRSEQRLAKELADTNRLQLISSRLIVEGNLQEIYNEICTTASDFMHSDASSLQVFSPDRKEFNLLAWTGFHPDSAKFWQRVEAHTGRVCGIAVAENQRIIIPDIESWEPVAGTKDIEAFRWSKIRSIQSTPLFTRSGQIVGMISTHWCTVHTPSEQQFRVLDVLARMTADLLERRQKEEALHKSQERLAADLADSKRLQQISSRLIEQNNPQELYEEILNDAMDFMHSDGSSLQILFKEKNELMLLGHKGFAPQSAKFWERVHVESGSTCGIALAQNRRITIYDVETCDFMQDTDDLYHYRLSGIRAVQSTPLVTRSGIIVGMISTHWRKVYEPSENEFRLLDVLARQAADLLERNQKEDALRKSQEMLAADLADTKKLHEFSSQLISEDDVEGIYEQLLNAASSIMHSEMATMQLFVPEKNALLLFAFKGIDPEIAKTWTWVQMRGETACGAALHKNKRIIIADVESSPFIPSEESRAAHRLAGIRSAQATPLITRSGEIIGMISTLWSTVHEPTERELRLMDVLARQGADLLERKQKEEALRKSQERLAADLEDTKQLQAISSELIEKDNVQALYEQLLNAAAAIMHAEMGCLQLLFPDKDELYMMAIKGFDPSLAAPWEWIKRGSSSSCGTALSRNARIIVPDIETCEFMKGTGIVEEYRLVGVRSMQSTPLVTRAGLTIGMITTHWDAVHEPTERELSLLDVLARQGADLFERKQKEEALRKTQQKLAADLEDTKQLQAISSELIQKDNVQAIYEQLLNAAAAVMHAEMGSLHLLNPDKDELSLLAIKGFDPKLRGPWEVIKRGSSSSSGMALASNKRIVVPDIETCDFMKGTGVVEKYRLGGVRSVQATPLITRSGHTVGMITTHWNTVHEPTERELNLLDVLARQTADLLERRQREEKYLTQLQQEVQERTLELRESKRLLQNIAETIPDMVSVQGYPQRNVIYYNREPYGLSGLSPEELSKMSVEERHKLVHPDDEAKLSACIASLAHLSNEDIATTEYRVKNKLRDWVWLRTRSKVFGRDEQGNVISFINVIQNITTEKESEEAIIELNNTLLAKNKDLETLNSELKTFNKVAAKDYKETIQVLYTNLEYIISNDARNLSNTAKANIRKAQGAIQRMKLLTEDINSYLALHDHEIKVSPTDPNLILQSVLARLKGKIEKAEANVNADKLPMLTADPLLLVFLMNNLIDNSIKFRSPATTPLIKITHSITDNLTDFGIANGHRSYIVISVSDNGIGIDELARDKIFELFYTAHDKTKYKGSGIGLAAAQKIMTLHGGYIKAEPCTNGTAIHCYFPA